MMRQPLFRLVWLTVLVVAFVDHKVLGSPFFAVDFNDLNPDAGVGGAPPSPTESAGGFLGFDVPHTSWPGTLAQRYTGIDPTLSTGAVTVWLGELNLTGGSFDGNGDLAAVSSPSLQARDRSSSPADGSTAGFAYGDLFRDVVAGVFSQSGNAPLAMELAGLNPLTSYRLTLWAYDHSFSFASINNRVTLADITPGSGGSSAIISSTGFAVRSNADYSANLVITTDPRGRLFVRSDANFNANHGLLNGFAIEAVPEPAAAATLLALFTTLLLAVGRPLLADSRRSRDPSREKIDAARRCRPGVADLPAHRRGAACTIVALLAFVVSRDAYATTYLFNTTFQNSGQPQTSPFSLWLPAEQSQVRGLIFMLPGSGGDYRSQVTKPMYEQAARSMGFGLVGSRDIGWGASPTETRAALQAVLDAAGAASGHGELSNVPLAVQGFSAGGWESAYLAQAAPDYVLSFVGNKLPGNSPFNAVPGFTQVPGLFIAGTSDVFVGVSSPRQSFDSWRPQGARVAFAVDWGASHADSGVQSAEMAWFWLAENIRLRYASGSTRADVQPLDDSLAWLGQTNHVTSSDTVSDPNPFQPIAPAAQYGGSATDASYLADGALANVYRALTSNPRPMTFTSPTFDVAGINPASFDTGVPITLRIDPKTFANVSRVEFYDGDQFLGLGSHVGSSWELSYAPQWAGVHGLVAIGVNTAGDMTPTFRTIVVVPEPGHALVFLAVALCSRRRSSASRNRGGHAPARRL